MQISFGDKVTDHNYLIHLDICNLGCYLKKKTIKGKDKVVSFNWKVILIFVFSVFKERRDRMHILCALAD